MVINCVAYGCNNFQDGRKRIPFHTFPFKRPDILKLWVHAVRREDWSPSKTSRLCGEHFLPSDYQEKPGCTLKILKPNAVPTIFSFREQLLKKPVLPHRPVEDTQKENDAIQIDSVESELNKPVLPHQPVEDSQKMNETMQIDLAESRQNSSIIQSTSAPLQKDQGTETRETFIDIDDKLFILRQKVKTLQQEVRKRDLKISILKNVIKDISRSGHTSANSNVVVEIDNTALSDS